MKHCNIPSLRTKSKHHIQKQKKSNRLTLSVGMNNTKEITSSPAAPSSNKEVNAKPSSLSLQVKPRTTSNKLTATTSSSSSTLSSTLPLSSSSTSKKNSVTKTPSLLGPLEEIFVILERLFTSKKALSSLPRGISRALYTIYQNLKLIRIHSIGQCQFANDLNIRMLNLKRQLEDLRRETQTNYGNEKGTATSTTSALPSTSSPSDNKDNNNSKIILQGDENTTSPSGPPLKEIFPVLRQTEKVVSTLQNFVASKPRLRLVLPAFVWVQLERMPDNLLLFPDHLARQLCESKSLLQRIVVLYNQLAEAHNNSIHHHQNSISKVQKAQDDQDCTTDHAISRNKTGMIMPTIVAPPPSPSSSSSTGESDPHTALVVVHPEHDSRLLEHLHRGLHQGNDGHSSHDDKHDHYENDNQQHQEKDDDDDDDKPRNWTAI